MDKLKEKTLAGTGTVKPKDKRRNNEKRKQKSRDAARCRRSRETEIFTELAHVLPLKREDVEQLDKASVMRLSIAFLKVREMLKLFPNIEKLKESKEELKSENNKEIKPHNIMENSHFNQLLTPAIDGFLLILSSEGDVTYVSENISEILGISQIDILGQPIWEYSHQCDHDELKEALNLRRSVQNDKKIDNKELLNNISTERRDVFLRLKCTLTSRGRSVNIKSASYKVIHLTGHVVMNNKNERILIGIGKSLPHPSNIEIPLGTTTFLTKHSLDMKFTYADDKMSTLLGYKSESLLGKSLYEFHHAADSENLMSTFKSVLSKGQSETCRYRFLGNSGGYCWIVTQATLVYDKQKPQSVVCVNYVISDIENNNEIYSCTQLDAYNKKNQLLSGQIKENHTKTILSKQHQQHKQQQIDKQSQKENFNNNNNNKNNNNENNSNIINKTNTNKFELNKQYQQRIELLKRINNSREHIQSLLPLQRIINNFKLTNGSRTYKPSRPRTVTASVFTQIPIPERVLKEAQALKLTSICNNAQNFITSSLSSMPPLINDNKDNINKNKKQNQRTEDMNKGYQIFTDDCPDLIMLKEDSNDLARLTPSAGDSCMQLEPNPLFDEVLDDLMLSDSYETLLSDEINSLNSPQSDASNNNRIDSYITYRDDSSNTSNSTHLLSPGSASKSPEIESMPSLCSPNSLSQDEFTFMTMDVKNEIDLAMRAPYIPMNEQDDLPLLTDDLMWSTFSDELNLPKDIKEALHTELLKNGNLINNLTGNNDSIDITNESNLTALLVANTLNLQDNLNSQKLKEIKRKELIDNDSYNLDETEEGYVQDFNKETINSSWGLTDLLKLNDTNTTQNNNNIYNNEEKQNIIVNRTLPKRTQATLLSLDNKIKRNNYDIDNMKSVTYTNNNNDTNSLNNHLFTKGINNINGNKNCNNTQQIDGNILLSVSTKRSLNFDLELEKKRIKGSSSTLDQRTSSQLLQQLMKNNTQKNISNDKLAETNQSLRWNSNDSSTQIASSSANILSESNSVLKNLLVNGCDVSAGYVCLVPTRAKKTAKKIITSELPDLIIDDDLNRETIIKLETTNSSYNSPLLCTTSNLQIDQNYGTNPLIGGVAISVSPPLPNLIPDDNNKATDNIDEKFTKNIYLENKTDYTESVNNIDKSVILNNKKLPSFAKLIKHCDKSFETLKKNTTKINLRRMKKTPTNEIQKLSIENPDPDNPLNSLSLMDLCNDDYTMEHAEANAYFDEFCKALYEWNFEMT